MIKPAAITIRAAINCMNIKEVPRGDKISAAHKQDKQINKRAKILQRTVFRPRNKKARKHNAASSESQISESDNICFIIVSFYTPLYTL